jgi:hypothetical protein
MEGGLEVWEPDDLLVYPRLGCLDRHSDYLSVLGLATFCNSDDALLAQVVSVLELAVISYADNALLMHDTSRETIEVRLTLGADAAWIVVVHLVQTHTLGVIVFVYVSPA